MNKEQITFLMDAGYTLDEIMQMQPAKQQDPQSAQQDPQPAQQKRQLQQLQQAITDLTKQALEVKDPQPDPQPAPQPVLQPDQTDQQIRQLTQAVADLTALVQKNNITGMQFGSPQPERSVDDILAEIINPPGKHLKGGTQ